MLFDQSQQDHLRRLIAAGVKLHFPFFANTFPIGFHYFREAQRQEKQGLLSLHSWADGVPTRWQQEAIAFYATARTVELNIENWRSHCCVYKSPFTRYRPKWLFVQYSSHIKSLSTEFERYGGTPQPTFCAELPRLLSKLYERIEVFTDIPNQAALIVTTLGQWGFSGKSLVAGSWDMALDFSSADQRVLKMFFCGAPVSSAMLRNPTDFICLGLPPHLYENDPEMKTYFVILSPTKLDESKELLADLREYHDQVFAAAASGNHHWLADVCWAFNRFTEIYQYNCAFPDSRAYAECIRDHHEPLIEPDEIHELR